MLESEGAVQQDLRWRRNEIMSEVLNQSFEERRFHACHNLFG
jgi:hypothetical protein